MEPEEVVGQRIRELREARGLSQDKFGPMAGIHRSYVGALERGETSMTIGTLKKVADALGVRVRELVDDL